MKTKLDELLKEKYGGKKYMELDGETRNNEDLIAAMEEEQEFLQKRYGSQSMYLALHTHRSRYNGFHKVSHGDMFTIYSDVLKRMVAAVDHRAVKGLAAAMDGDNNDEHSLSAKDFKELLEQLPPEVHDAVLEKMGSMAGATVPDAILKTKRKGKKTDEDSLIDDILS